jgi:arylsulfatase A-like enzyme
MADHIHCGHHSTDLLGGTACRFVRDYQGAAPFFLYLAFLAPHDPRTMPEEFRAQYDGARLELPPNCYPEHPFDNGDLRVRDELLAPLPRTPENTRRHLAEYYAMIAHLDHQVGRLLDALAATGRLDDTYIVLAGDNGLALGQHGLFGKQSLYDHSVRVPLLISGPGLPANQRCATPAYLLDIYPTLCELLGLPTPASVEGRSLVPQLHQPAAPGREQLYLAYQGCQRGLRRGHHKLIEYVVGGRHAMTQLFDLAADPWEQHNLAADPAHATLLASLRQALREERDRWDDRATKWGQTFWSALPD